MKLAWLTDPHFNFLGAAPQCAAILGALGDAAAAHWPLPNLCVRTGGAEYGAPRTQPPILFA